MGGRGTLDPQAWHDGEVEDVALSPDGREVASIGRADNMLTVSDLTSDDTATDRIGDTQSVAYSPDGRYLVITENFGSVDVMDVHPSWLDQEYSVGLENNQFLIHGHKSRVTDAAFAPDGEHIASASRDGTLRIWDVRGSTRRVDLAVPSTSTPARRSRRTVDCSRRDRRRTRAAICASGTCADGVVPLKIDAHDVPLFGLAFSPDGDTVATASQDTTVRLWDAHTGAPVATLTGHTDSVEAVAFSPDGKLLASVGGDRTLRVHDLRSGRVVKQLPTKEKYSLNAVAFTPDGKTVATAGVAGTINLWPLEGAGEPKVMQGHSGPVKSLSFSNRRHARQRRRGRDRTDLTGRRANRCTCSPAPSAVRRVDERGRQTCGDESPVRHPRGLGARREPGADGAARPDGGGRDGHERGARAQRTLRRDGHR